jgi:hypothetical protein|tara:strand:+ start:2771 stop:2914 length:144 start_codon:yes stop_codon:yes gene_type:complete
MFEMIGMIVVWFAALGVICLWTDYRRMRLQKIIDKREKKLLDKEENI